MKDSSGNNLLREKNVYILDFGNNNGEHIYLSSMTDDPYIWNVKLGHASMRLIEKLVKKDLVLNHSSWTIQKITSATHVKWVIKQETHFMERILSPDINPYNSYTWTYLDLTEHPASVVKGTLL